MGRHLRGSSLRDRASGTTTIAPGMRATINQSAGHFLGRGVEERVAVGPRIERVVGRGRRVVGEVWDVATVELERIFWIERFDVEALSR